MNSGPAPSLELRAVSCARHGAAVADISFEITQPGFHVLTGADGANELLLRLLGLLEVPDSGEISFAGQRTAALEEQARAELRSRYFGYVFAAPFLLPSFSVVENLAMPLFRVQATTPTEARNRAERMLDFVGLAGREEERAGDLPAALQHSVALARALITQPQVLIVEGVDRHLAGAELKHYCALLRQASAGMGIIIIATASHEWRAEPGDQVFEVRERSIQAAAPVEASSSS